jgi:hypothetical protein
MTCGGNVRETEKGQIDNAKVRQILDARLNPGRLRAD